MAAIVISQVTVTNPQQYEAYKPLAKAAIEAFGGRYHVRGSMPSILEGTPADRRYVVVEFDSVETAQKFYDSDLYRKAKEARKGAAIADIIVLEGV
ncbi:MAG: DUF1330 domain-containing protein [Xanthobacteraceae bacterium]